MYLTSSRGQAMDEADPGEVQKALLGFRDAHDYLILQDPALGQLRATGYPEGGFLLRCEFFKDGKKFLGEAEDISLGEALSICTRFLAGEVGWSRQFRKRKPLLPYWVMRLLGVIGGI